MLFLSGFSKDMCFSFITWFLIRYFTYIRYMFLIWLPDVYTFHIQWSIDYSKHKFKVHGDFHTLSQCFVWITILLFNQLAEFWVAYFRVVYFPATYHVPSSWGICLIYIISIYYNNIIQRDIHYIYIYIYMCMYVLDVPVGAGFPHHACSRARGSQGPRASALRANIWYDVLVLLSLSLLSVLLLLVVVVVVVVCVYMFMFMFMFWPGP